LIDSHAKCTSQTQYYKINIVEILTAADSHSVHDLKLTCFEALFAMGGDAIVENPAFKGMGAELLLEAFRDFVVRRKSHLKFAAREAVSDAEPEPGPALKKRKADAGGA